MKKNIIFSLMLVAMFATMSVGLSSCSKDDDGGGKASFTGKWKDGDTKTIEFKKDGSFSYVYPQGTTAGSYEVIETVEGARTPDGFNATLFKLSITPPTSVYNQLWVYHVKKASNTPEQLGIYAYQNNERKASLGGFTK